LINLTVGVGGQLLVILFSFLGRMVFIRYLSAEYLGINGLFFNVLSILGLAELGIGSAMVFSMYRPAAEHDEIQLSRLMNLYRVLYRFVALAVALLGLALFPFLKDLIREEGEGVSHLELIYFMYLFEAVCSYLLSYKNSILLAHQRAYFKVGVGHILHIAQLGLQILVLVLWNNFILYLSLQIARQLAVNIIAARKADRAYPYLKACRELPDRQTRREIEKNIWAMSMHRLGTVIVNGTDNLVMSAFIGLKSVGIYSNYQIVFSSVSLIMTKACDGFSSSIGNLGAGGDSEKIYNVYQTLDFLFFLLYGYLSVGLFVMLNPLIEMAFGAHYLFSAGTVGIVVINFYITGMRQINLQFRTALGLFWRDRYKAVAEAAINLIASVLLVSKYEAAGVFLGTIVSSLATCFWVEPYIFMRYGIKNGWKKKLGRYFAVYTLRGITVLSACAVSYQICQRLPGDGLGLFFVKGCLCTAVYAVLILLVYSRSRQWNELKRRGIAFAKKYTCLNKL